MSLIPSVDDLKSDVLTHRFGDFFNPPALTNFMGCVQVDTDITAIRNLNFPPFATGNTITAAFVLDGRHFQSFGVPVTFVWYPDRIVREAEWNGFRLRSTTILVVGQPDVLTVVDVTNESGHADSIEIGLNVRHTINRVDLWDQGLPAMDTGEDRLRVATSEGVIVAATQDNTAATVCTVWPEPSRTTSSGFRYDLKLSVGSTWRMTFASSLTDDPGAAVARLKATTANPEPEIDSSRDSWNSELADLFTAGNSRYSGHLPVLETDDAAILKLYWMGAAGLAYFKRESPFSSVGRAYDTLMPRFWQTLTCIWDYSLSSPAHALLDPVVLRTNLERWMLMDTHRHFGTEYLNDHAIGPWYAVNDFAMASMIHRYAFWTGDEAWLSKRIGPDVVADHLVGYAQSWDDLRGPSGLASFGDQNNLLECVGTYVHEVASLNAAGVYSMRCAGDIIELTESRESAASWRARAERQLAMVQELYVAGGGYWQARMPDGTMREVRHAYDFLTVLTTIPEDLTREQQSEMVQFFQNELKTETWMRALSAQDDDVLFSTRPDHQWTGAYAAWPSEAAKGLCRIGRADLAASWMRGLARSANQGPFAQAHMADGVMAGESGGAIKSSPEFPYINDWHSSSSGSWVSAIIEGLFGVEVGIDGVSARPQIDEFDREARLTGLKIRGRNFTVDRTGIHEDGESNAG
jgi:hypothetical protein